MTPTYYKQTRYETSMVQLGWIQLGWMRLGWVQLGWVQFLWFLWCGLLCYLWLRVLCFLWVCFLCAPVPWLSKIWTTGFHVVIGQFKHQQGNSTCKIIQIFQESLLIDPSNLIPYLTKCVWVIIEHAKYYACVILEHVGLEAYLFYSAFAYKRLVSREVCAIAGWFYNRLVS